MGWRLFSRTTKGAGRSKKRGKGDDELPAPSVVGGFAFYLSLIVILPSGCAALILALTLISSTTVVSGTSFLISAMLGALLGHSLIRGHISVLIHEFKHELISNLVGNKKKGMKIEKNSGYFRYEYTKDTSHFNAFISLAPYIVPVFTFVTALFAAAFSYDHHTMAACIVGLGYGADLVLNLRDISPIQTDLTFIRGGYRVALLYITSWTILFLAFMLAWALSGINGWLYIIEKASIGFVLLHQWCFLDDVVEE